MEGNQALQQCEQAGLDSTSAPAGDGGVEIHVSGTLVGYRVECTKLLLEMWKYCFNFDNRRKR